MMTKDINAVMETTAPEFLLAIDSSSSLAKMPKISVLSIKQLMKSDADTITETGLYQCVSVSNLPHSENGMLLVVNFGAGYLWQVLFPNFSDYIYTRRSAAGTFHSWKRLTPSAIV